MNKERAKKNIDKLVEELQQHMQTAAKAMQIQKLCKLLKSP